MSEDTPKVEPQRTAFDGGKLEGFSVKEIVASAAKDILNEYTQKAVNAFVNFPKKRDFGVAAFFAMQSVGAATLSALATVPDIPGREWIAGVPLAIRAVPGAIFAAASIITGGASAGFFREWYQTRWASRAASNKINEHN